MVDRCVAENLVENPEAKGIREPDITLVRQNDDSQMPVEFETDEGSEAGSASVMPDDSAVRRLRDDPAERVTHLVVKRHFRSSRNRQIFRRDDRFSFEAAVIELE